MLRKIVLLVGVALISILLFWSPFLGRIGSFWGINFQHRGMETIIQNFDGLNFLVVAKSMYNPARIEMINQQFLTGNDPLYFTAHYPGFPLIIKFFDFFLTGPQALLAAIILSNTLLAIALLLFFQEILKNRLAVVISAIALFLPPRMLSDRAVGANEALFIALILLSLVFANKGKQWLAASMGALAVITRSPGILLFVAYILVIVWNNINNWRKIVKDSLPYFLIPLALLGVWLFYGYAYGDPLAYFKAGVSMNIHLPPFLAFGTNQEWITGMWRDDIFYLYLIFGGGIFLFKQNWFKKKNLMTMTAFVYGLIYLISIFFVAHRDVARYSLPMAPIVLAGYSKYLTDKKIRWLLVLLLIPLYLLGWQFVLQNIQPVNDWGVLL